MRVALDVPVPTLFDYLLPEELHAVPAALVGCRVRVAFGRTRQIGVVLETAASSSLASDRLKQVGAVLETEPVLVPDVLELITFASRYYHHPIGQSIATALPRQFRATAGTREAKAGYALSESGRALDIDRLPARARAQRGVLLRLHDEAALAAADLRQSVPGADGALRALLRLGHVQRVAMPAATAGTGTAVVPAAPAAAPELTAAQRDAVAAVLGRRGTFAPFLLHGVTGSGKTEVYLRLIGQMLEGGRQSLILVPEIGLTPQLLERVRARFPAACIVSLHSNLAEGERLRGWRAAQRGEAAIVIGTRLAVFTPMPQLGLIVVDEEHDASFKQQEGLRYCARDLALFRARLRGVPIVLGSATPSMESHANVDAGRYALLRLPYRAAAALPVIRCLDTRREHLQHGLSPRLIEAIRQRIGRREQSLVFVNRRGYSPALVCPACGWTSPCPRCSARLVLHLKDRRLCCHYCGHQAPIDRACGSCGNQNLLPAGHGTQRIEQALQEALPGASIVRVDRDSTRGREAFLRLQRDVRGQRIDVLVGTQMLAKGHDFPHITLVGVLNADSLLYSTDFRASERLYAQLTQVAGRAGRGELPGEVLIQTAFPDHPLYEAVCRQDYEAFARATLEERRATGFPPYAFQALLRAEASRREAVESYLLQAVAAGMAIGAPVEIYDPVPPAIARIAGNERGHVLVQAQSRAALQAFLQAWYPQLSSRTVRWSLDVDPLEL